LRRIPTGYGPGAESGSAISSASIIIAGSGVGGSTRAISGLQDEIATEMPVMTSKIPGKKPILINPNLHLASFESGMSNRL
jgi:hypothetical protein